MSEGPAKKRKAAGVSSNHPGLEEILSQFSDAHALTPREKQVFLRVCSGKKNFLVATEMGLSDATIRLHITNLHRKLGTGNKVDLLVKAFQWWLAEGSRQTAKADGKLKATRQRV